VAGRKLIFEDAPGVQQVTITSVDSLIAALIATPDAVGKDAATNKAAGRCIRRGTAPGRLALARRPPARSTGPCSVV